MTLFLVTGGIGSGKSEVCRYLVSRGIPVYDSDSRTKALYDSVPDLAARIDAAMGGGVLRDDGTLDRKALAGIIFNDSEKLRTLESIVHPEVLKDFLAWKDSLGCTAAAMESAIAAGLGIFEGVFDFTILVDAPMDVRIERACMRDSASREAVSERIANQSFDASKADAVIVNDASLDELHSRTDEALEKCLYLQNIKEQKYQTEMKTDLSRILAVSGHRGLYKYIAQARSGAIAECLADGKRTIFDVRSRITTLADIAIYTSEGELRLKDVFAALHEVLGDADAPSQKASSDEFKALFAQAVPDYDEDRFYVSHMKKVSEWYNDLKNYASLEFVEEEEAEENQEEASQDPSND
ncbi:MAG: dephospho-CoA kinase [Bacteroidia bacterium]|nr:dephospho-CoA kinase [Bacteroidia bacterium]